MLVPARMEVSDAHVAIDLLFANLRRAADRRATEQPCRPDRRGGDDSSRTTITSHDFVGLIPAPGRIRGSTSACPRTGNSPQKHAVRVTRRRANQPRGRHDPYRRGAARGVPWPWPAGTCSCCRARISTPSSTDALSARIGGGGCGSRRSHWRWRRTPARLNVFRGKEPGCTQLTHRPLSNSDPWEARSSLLTPDVAGVVVVS